jgi:thioredoxin-dependent peroxiredoxin
MLKPGSKAPSFELISDEGKKVSLKDFAGKKVVLYFYPRDNTPGCTTEACSFAKNNKKLQKAGAVVVGISADSVASHQKFKQRYDLGFTLLSDPDREVIQKYGVWKEKNMYGKRMMGIERTTFIIDEQGKIARIFPKVKVDGHTEQILKAL